MLKVKADIALHGNPISELWDVTCHVGSHSVTCHPTQVNAPRVNPSHAGWYSIYLPRRDGRLSCPIDLIAPRPGVEPATFRSRVRRRTAAPPRQPWAVTTPLSWYCQWLSFSGCIMPVCYIASRLQPVATATVNPPYTTVKTQPDRTPHNPPDTIRR